MNDLKKWCTEKAPKRYLIEMAREWKCHIKGSASVDSWRHIWNDIYEKEQNNVEFLQMVETTYNKWKRARQFSVEMRVAKSSCTRKRKREEFVCYRKRRQKLLSRDAVCVQLQFVEKWIVDELDADNINKPVFFSLEEPVYVVARYDQAFSEDNKPCFDAEFERNGVIHHVNMRFSVPPFVLPFYYQVTGTQFVHDVKLSPVQARIVFEDDESFPKEHWNFTPDMVMQWLLVQDVCIIVQSYILSIS